MELMTEKIIKNLDLQNLTVVNAKKKIDYKKMKGIVVFDNILSQEKSPKTIIENTAKAMERGHFLVIVDRVVDIDDAFVNVLAFIKDKKHIRFYTVSEVIEMTQDYFRLSNYDIVANNNEFNKPTAKLIDEYNKLPVVIKELISYKFNDGVIYTKQRYGVYTFVKY